MPWPLEDTVSEEFAENLEKIIVVEEKRSIIETQVKEISFNKNMKVKVVGKKNELGNDLFISSGALDPGEIGLKIYQIIKDLELPEEINNFSKQLKSLTESNNSKISLKRIPHFCSGCHHNT